MSYLTLVQAAKPRIATYAASSMGSGKPTISNVLRQYKRREGARWYAWSNDEYPLLTRGLTGGLLAAAGDAVAQFMAWRGKSDKDKAAAAENSVTGTGFDLQRNFAFFAYSIWYNASPWNHYIAFANNPANTVLSTPIRRAMFTTTVFNPLFYLPTFYVGFGLLTFQSFDTIKQTLTYEYPEAVKQILMVYAPIYALQFSVIPASMQVVYSSLANFCWCVILSSMAASETQLTVSEDTGEVWFHRFDSSAITVQKLAEKAQETVAVSQETVDQVFAQLKDPNLQRERRAAQWEVKEAVEESSWPSDAAAKSNPLSADFSLDFAEFSRQVQAASVAFRFWGTETDA